MDTSKANTESYLRHIRNHEMTNDMIQLTTTALNLLGEESKSLEGEKKLAMLVNKADPQWNKPHRTMPNSKQRIQSAQANLSNLTIVRALSALDLFVHDALLELCRFSEQVRSRPGFVHMHSAGLRPSCCAAPIDDYMKDRDLAARVLDAWPIVGHELPAIVNGVFPLYTYFRLARNRIAHFAEIAGQHLVDYSKEVEFQEALKLWYGSISRKKDRARPLPTLKRGGPIIFQPHHSILASAVCQRIAKSYKEACVQLLGAEGLVSMAAHVALEKDPPGGPLRQRSVEAVVVNYLRTRYGVKNATEGDIVATLQTGGFWEEAVSRYSTLQARGVIGPARKR
jgi:hypothetical protein